MKFVRGSDFFVVFNSYSGNGLNGDFMKDFC